MYNKYAKPKDSWPDDTVSVPHQLTLYITASSSPKNDSRGDLVSSFIPKYQYQSVSEYQMQTGELPLGRTDGRKSCWPSYVPAAPSLFTSSRTVQETDWKRFTTTKSFGCLKALSRSSFGVPEIPWCGWHSHCIFIRNPGLNYFSYLIPVFAPAS